MAQGIDKTEKTPREQKVLVEQAGGPLAQFLPFGPASARVCPVDSDQGTCPLFDPYLPSRFIVK